MDRRGAGHGMSHQGDVMEEYLQEPKGSALRDGAAATAVTLLTIALIIFLGSRII